MLNGVFLVLVSHSRGGAGAGNGTSYNWFIFGVVWSFSVLGLHDYGIAGAVAGYDR